MIDAKELRTGNIIHNGFKPVIVQGVDGEGVILMMRCRGMSIPEGPHRPEYEWEKLYLGFDEALPIPLTPEILEKCGFLAGADHMKGQWVFVNGASLFPDGQYFTYLDQRRPLSTVKYLHQLQNLYYRLTGQELEVKL
jgi:hypothetical protein